MFGACGGGSSWDPTPVATVSFPPATHSFARLDIDAPLSILANDDENNIETEEDWVIDQQSDELEQVQPSKFSEAIAKEVRACVSMFSKFTAIVQRPVWADLVSTTRDPSGFDQISSGSYLGPSNIDTSPASNATVTSSVPTPGLSSKQFYQQHQPTSVT